MRLLTQKQRDDFRNEQINVLKSENNADLINESGIIIVKYQFNEKFYIKAWYEKAGKYFEFYCFRTETGLNDHISSLLKSAKERFAYKEANKPTANKIEEDKNFILIICKEGTALISKKENTIEIGKKGTKESRKFSIGDTIETGSYNLVYTGTIKKITKSYIECTHISESRIRRMKISEFIYGNYDLDLNKIAKNNSEWYD
jgi:hypothetical protein